MCFPATVQVLLVCARLRACCTLSFRPLRLITLSHLLSRVPPDVPARLRRGLSVICSSPRRCSLALPTLPPRDSLACVCGCLRAGVHRLRSVVLDRSSRVEKRCHAKFRNQCEQVINRLPTMQFAEDSRKVLAVEHEEDDKVSLSAAACTGLSLSPPPFPAAGRDATPLVNRDPAPPLAPRTSLVAMH